MASFGLNNRIAYPWKIPPWQINSRNSATAHMLWANGTSAFIRKNVLPPIGALTASLVGKSILEHVRLSYSMKSREVCRDHSIVVEFGTSMWVLAGSSPA